MLGKCVCRSTHAQCLKNPQACKSETHTYTHALTCSSLHLFSCVLFPPAMVSLEGLEDSAAPGDRTGALIDSREFGGRGASKTALLLPLSSRPSALWAPVMGSLSVANTLRKINTSLLGCTGVYMQHRKVESKKNVFYGNEKLRNTLEIYFEWLSSCQLYCCA